MSSRHSYSSSSSKSYRARERSRSPISRRVSSNPTREDIVRQRRIEREEKEKRNEAKIKEQNFKADDEEFPKISYDPSDYKKATVKDEKEEWYTEQKPETKDFDKIIKGEEDPESKPEVKEKKPKEKANLGLSGALTADTNTYKGVVIKYSEPDDAKKPKKRWRIYPFKGDEALPAMHIHRQSAFLIGKHRGIVDIAIDHPSCSRQHAALQYRRVTYKRHDGSTGYTVKPYLIDLESANKTYLNGKPLDPRRYYELKEKDVIKFGMSSRDYVILLDNSAENEDDLQEVGDDGKTGEDLLEEFLDSQVKKRTKKIG